MRYVILAVNDNPVYTQYKELVSTMWRIFNWEPFWVDVPKIEGFTSVTCAQVCRIYAAALPVFTDSDFLMTSDADMLPMSDYWDPKQDHAPTCWGRDLTDYHYPICYIGATAYKWRWIMNLDGMSMQTAMQRDMRQQKNIWCLDQDIVTEKINAYHQPPHLIDRGTDRNTGYPIGRLDRSNWKFNGDRIYIDCHLPHAGKQKEMDELMAHLKLKFGI